MNTEYLYQVRVIVDDETGETNIHVNSNAGDVGRVSGQLGVRLGRDVGYMLISDVRQEHFGDGELS